MYVCACMHVMFAYIYCMYVSVAPCHVLYSCAACSQSAVLEPSVCSYTLSASLMPGWTLLFLVFSHSVSVTPLSLWYQCQSLVTLLSVSVPRHSILSVNALSLCQCHSLVTLSSVSVSVPHHSVVSVSPLPLCS